MKMHSRNTKMNMRIRSDKQLQMMSRMQSNNADHFQNCGTTCAEDGTNVVIVFSEPQENNPRQWVHTSSAQNCEQ